MALQAQDTLTLQSPVSLTDTLTISQEDSVAAPMGDKLEMGLVFTDPDARFREESDGSSHDVFGWGMSWIYLLLAVLFCVTGLKFKGSSRYLRALVADMTDTRLRNNVFDDTVKETSLIILLNIMWVFCAGIMLWIGVRTHASMLPEPQLLPFQDATGVALCCGMAFAYLLLTFVAYWIAGNVFADSHQTHLWMKGAAASTGLQSFLLFPVAIIALNYPSWNLWLLGAAVAVFLAGKIVFLYQGFRIFFTQISSWLLFLYYLCSLEIIPVILTWVAACQICLNGFSNG